MNNERQPKHLVRPRWAWGGLLLMLAGCALAGVVLALGRWWYALVGGVVLLCGAVIAWRGGIVYDAGPHVDLGQEMRDVVKGNVHRGVAPGDMATPERARQVAEIETKRKERIEAVSERTPYPGFASIGVHLMLLVALWLLVSQSIFPHDVPGKNNSLRDTGLAIVTALAALWLRQMGPNRVAYGLCLACGAGLVLFAFFLPHERTAVFGSETVSGALIVIGAVASMDRRNGGDMTSRRGASE